MKSFKLFLAATILSAAWIPASFADTSVQDDDKSLSPDPRRGRGDGRIHGRHPPRPNRPRPNRPRPYRRVRPYPYRVNPYYNNYRYSDQYYGSVACSPEVRQKNIVVMENTIGDLLEAPLFANAEKLRVTVDSIQEHKDVDTRIAAYCSLVGVDARSPEQLAEFIGARDMNVYVKRAQKNLDLTQEQAKVLANTLSQNLLNGINQ